MQTRTDQNTQTQTRLHETGQIFTAPKSCFGHILYRQRRNDLQDQANFYQTFSSGPVNFVISLISLTLHSRLVVAGRGLCADEWSGRRCYDIYWNTYGRSWIFLKSRPGAWLGYASVETTKFKVFLEKLSHRSGNLCFCLFIPNKNTK